MDYGPTTAQRKLLKTLIQEREVSSAWLLETAAREDLTRQMTSQVINKLMQCRRRVG